MIIWLKMPIYSLSKDKTDELQEKLDDRKLELTTLEQIK